MSGRIERKRRSLRVPIKRSGRDPWLEHSTGQKNHRTDRTRR